MTAHGGAKYQDGVNRALLYANERIRARLSLLYCTQYDTVQYRYVRRFFNDLLAKVSQANQPVQNVPVRVGIVCTDVRYLPTQAGNPPPDR